MIKVWQIRQVGEEQKSLQVAPCIWTQATQKLKHIDEGAAIVPDFLLNIYTNSSSY